MRTKVDLRVQNPKAVNGKKMFVTTVKTAVIGNVQETTLKRTIDGEHADLQLKFILHADGRVEYLHIHCLKDKELSFWGKASELPIEKLYDVSQGDRSQIIRCKICNRAWSSSGWQTSPSTSILN
jgi:hypothetical protein